MDIKQLEYFVTIVNEGSISAASRKLFMTQPPISNQMKLLEEELGCKLFERKVNGVQLTAEGTLLYQKANQILALVDDTMMTVGNLKDRKVLKVGMVSSIVEDGTTLLADFKKQQPNLVIEISEANTYRLLELLDNNQIDVAIVRKPYPAAQYHEINLGQDSLVAVGYDLPEKVDLQYLSQQPLIVYRRWQSIIAKQFENHQYTFSYQYLNDDARTSLALASKKMGIALVPFSSTKSLTEMDVRSIEDCDIVSQVQLIYNQTTENNKAFIEYVSNKSFV